MRKFALIAALLAATFFILTVHPGASRHRSVGLQVKIALPVPCRPDLIPGEIVRVLRPGLVRLNSEELTLEELDRRLETTFRSRVQRVVFVSGDGALSFRDVVAVIDIASKHADYTALVTPSVDHSVTPQTGNCLDPNIKFPQILM
jgi:biopolymer transport protein ExbD